LAETEFSIAYDGPALETGRMPVRDLAPALLALGDLFADASLVVYPDREPVALSIRATEDGSFLVRLILESKSAWDQFVDIFGGDSASALANLEAIVIGGSGLFWFIKRRGKKEITAQEPAPEPGHVRLTLEDGTVIEVSAQVLKLYDNITIRRKARQVVAPLHREGVELVRFEPSKPDAEVVIEKEDLPAYELPTAEEALLDHETEMILEIVSVSFPEGSKWRFTDGAKSFYAVIEDEAFLDRIETGVEAFRKGDMLRCRVRIIQTQRHDGLHTEYRIVEVLEHIPRATQMRLSD
jgi:hypothetical protein